MAWHLFGAETSVEIMMAKVAWCVSSPGGWGALRVKISRGARLEIQNGTQQDLNEIIDLVNFGGKKIVYMLKMGGFEMGPNKIWIKW